MADIIYRIEKGEGMLNSEVDSNFRNLNEESANTIANVTAIENLIGNTELLDSANLITGLNEKLDSNQNLIDLGNLASINNLTELANISGFDLANDGSFLFHQDGNWEVLDAKETLNELGIAGAGGGSGLFNTEIRNATGIELSTTGANVITAAPNTTIILHSIQLVNLKSDNEATVDISLVGPAGTSTYEDDVTIGENVPVFSGTSMEFLKKPKILSGGDSLRMNASESNTLFATVTYEISEDDRYFGSGKDIVTADTDFDLIVMEYDGVIESVLLSNDEAGANLDVLVTVSWTDSADVIKGYFAYNLNIPTGSTVEILENPKFIPSGNKVKVKANTANRVEATIAGKYVPVE